MIRVSADDFNVGSEVEALTRNNPSDGAVVTFIGLVRDFNQGETVTDLFLEHYPGMTEKVLQQIIDEAKQRWKIGRISIIHRVGKLLINDQIVFVGVTSKHRKDAFECAEFVMDFLKTKAPFWKQETLSDSKRWVEARLKDTESAARW